MPAAFSLHVLPPAFSLPSIDAECLAAIAYFTWTLPRNSWTLIGESGLENNQQLPCLRDTSAGKKKEVIVYGLDSIVRHLKQVSRGQWDLDASLRPQEKADCVAFTSHLTQTLSPLVDLSLYICAENYDSATRVAYGASLPFPDSWVVPPERMRNAQARTSHLGLDAEDLSNSNPTSPRTPRSISNSPPQRAFDDPAPLASGGSINGIGSGIGGSWFGLAKPASLASQAVASARLTALIEAALQPLAALQQASGGRRYLAGDYPCTLDCHALALLSLAVLPSLENPFLAAGFAGFDGLEKYTRRTIRECFGPPVTVSDALVRAPFVELDTTTAGEEEEEDDDGVEFEAYENAKIGSGDVHLPWRRGRRTAIGVARGVAQAVAG